MKLNPLSSSSSHPLVRRAPQIAALFVLVLAVQVACSDAPTQGTPVLPGTSGTATGGTPAGTAGTAGSSVMPTAGTVGTAGSFATGGTGGTFSTAGTAGTATAGTGGTTAGTGGTTAGTANGGTGGVIVPVAYCMGKTPSALPFPVNMGWQPSGWSAGGVGSPISVATDLVGAADACTARPPGAAAVSDCSKWHYTPVAQPTDAWVIWSYAWDPGFTHPGVCLADGAKAISFCARGAVGGEKIQVGGAGVADAPLPPLTTEWKPYSVTLAADYNGFDNGVPTGFDWKVLAADNTGVVTFFFDKLQFTASAPAADYCGSGNGEGGAGGAGGAGGGGAGGAP